MQSKGNSDRLDLRDRITLSRRQMLAAMGIVGASGYAAGSRSLNDPSGDPNVYAAGFGGSLTSQKRKETYVSAPDSAFDQTALEENELAIVPDAFGLAAYDGSDLDVLRLGSATNPSPGGYFKKMGITQVAADAGPTSNKTISSGSVTTVPIDSAGIEDTDVITVDTTNNKFTTQVDGLWLITGVASWGPDNGWTTGDSAKIRANVGGSTETFGNQVKTGTGGEGIPVPPVIIDVTANTDIKIEAFQDSGSNQDIRGDSDKKTTRLVLVRLG